jgi:PAS domain-containing protein
LFFLAKRRTDTLIEDGRASSYQQNVRASGISSFVFIDEPKMSYQQNRRNQTHEYTADNVAREDRKRSRPSENDCQYPEKRVRIIAAEEPSSTGKLVPSIEVQPDPFGTIEVQPSNAKQVFDTELDTYAQIPKESIQKSTTEEPSNSGASLPLGNTDRSPKGTIDIQSIKAKRTPEPELQSEAEEVNNKIDGNTLDSSKKAGTMDSFEKMNSGQDRGRALYGDMVDTTIGCICFFIYGAELFRMDKDDPKYGTAVRVYLALVFPLVFLFPAVVTKNLWMSRLGMISVASALGYLNLAEWPYEGECEITRMMQGQILMVVLTNLSLSFVEKVLRLVFLFGVGTYVSIQSPFSVYFEDTLPILGGTVLMAFFGLYVFHFGIGRQLATVQGSQLVLASLFVYYTLMDMSLSMDSMSLSAYINLSSYLKAVVLACLGLIATSTFQQEIKHKEQLEVLVSERTKKIQDQNKKLRMVSMALQASETAIAITNGAGIIIWINAAFEHLCQKKEEVLIDIPLNDAFSNLDPARKDEIEYTLFRAFQDHTNPSENELQIRESIFRLEVTPFDAEDENHSKSKDDSHREINDRFLVVFKNITSGRARELAEQKAHDKAMMAKAMGDAMVTLTHELRTPLQGIMGVTSLLLQQATDLNHDMLESLKLIMASSSLLLNLINNLLDIKKVTAKSKYSSFQ